MTTITSTTTVFKDNDLFISIYRSAYLRNKIYEYFGESFRNDGYNLCFSGHLFESYDDMSLVSIFRSKNVNLIQEKLDLFRKMMTGQPLPTNKQRQNTFYQDMLDIPKHDYRTNPYYYYLAPELLSDKMFSDLCFLYKIHGHDISTLFTHFIVTVEKVKIVDNERMPLFPFTTSMKYDHIKTVQWLYDKGRFHLDHRGTRKFFNSSLFLENYQVFSTFDWPTEILFKDLINDLSNPNRVEYLKLVLKKSKYFNNDLQSTNKGMRSMFKSMMSPKEPSYKFYGVNVIARKDDDRIFKQAYNHFNSELWQFIKQAYPNILSQVYNISWVVLDDYQYAKKYLKEFVDDDDSVKKPLKVLTNGSDLDIIKLVHQHKLTVMGSKILDSPDNIEYFKQTFPDEFLKRDLLDNPYITDIPQLYQELVEIHNIEKSKLYECLTMDSALKNNRLDIVKGLFSICQKVDWDLLLCNALAGRGKEVFEFLWTEYVLRNEIINDQIILSLCHEALQSYDSANFIKFFQMMPSDYENIVDLLPTFKQIYEKLSYATNEQDKRNCVDILNYCKSRVIQVDGTLSNTAMGFQTLLSSIQDSSLIKDCGGKIDFQERIQVMKTSILVASIPLAKLCLKDISPSDHSMVSEKIKGIILDYYRQFMNPHHKVPLYLIQQFPQIFTSSFIDKLVRISVKNNNFIILHIILNRTNIRLVNDTSTIEETSSSLKVQKELLETTFMSIWKSAFIKDTSYFNVFPMKDIVDLTSKRFKQHSFVDSPKHYTKPSLTRFKSCELPFKSPYSTAL